MSGSNECLVRTQNFGVRKFHSSLSGNISKWLSEDEFELFMTSSCFKFPVSKSDFEAYWQLCDVENKHEFLEVFHLDSSLHIGHFELKNINMDHEIGTLAHVIIGDKNFRGKGFGKEFCDLMLSYGFKFKNLHRLSVSVHLCNIPAVASYIKGRFSFEGIIKDVLKFDGDRYSLYQMSILRHDWELICSPHD